MNQQRFSKAAGPARGALLACALASGALHACARTVESPAQPQPAAPTEAVGAQKAEPSGERPRIKGQICALAPDSASGLRMLETLARADATDTLALVNGQRVPLAKAVGAVHVASDAPWMSGERTLDIRVGRRVLRYRLYDVGRIIAPGDLAYLGTVDSIPVYVAATDLVPLQLAGLRMAAGTRDLPRLIAANAALRTRMRAIDVLYVPLRATGCIFQPMLRQATP